MINKVVVITGASSGIGESLVHEYTSNGYIVVLASRNHEKINEIATQIRINGGQSLAIKTDVRIEEDCKNLIAQTINKFGRIDILINNAGVSMRAMFADLDLKVIKELMDTNFWGCVYCTKYALPHIIESKGSIVGVSSIAGYLGLPARTGYSASKYAMHGFLNTLRIEYLHDPIHVMIACPSFTSTNIRRAALNSRGETQGKSPRNESRMMNSEKVARIIYKAIKRRKRTVIISLTGKLSIFLNKIMPGVFDHITYQAMKKEKNSPLK